MINPGTHVVVPSGRTWAAQLSRRRRLRRGRAVGLVMDVGVAFEGGACLRAVVGAEEQFTTTGIAGPPKAWAPHRSHRSAADRLGASAAFTVRPPFALVHPGTGVPSTNSQTRGILPDRSLPSRPITWSVTVCPRGRARIPSGPRGGPGVRGLRLACWVSVPPHPRTSPGGHRREEPATTKSTQDYTAHHRRSRGPGAVRKRPGMYIGPPTVAASCTASGRSSTTPSTRPSVATATGSRSSLRGRLGGRCGTTAVASRSTSSPRPG